MRMNDLKIAPKMMLGSGVILLLVVIMSIFGSYQLQRIDGIYTNVIDNVAAGNATMLKIRVNYANLRRIAVSYALDIGNKEKVEKVKENYDNEQQLLKNTFAEYITLVSNDNEVSENVRTETVKTIKAIENRIVNEYGTYIDKIYKAALSGNHDEMVANISQAASLSESINKEINLETKSTETFMDEQNSVASVMSDTANFTLIILAVVSVIVGVIIVLTLSLKMKKRLEEITEITERISEGDFNVDVGSNDKDEIGLLSNSMLHLKNSVLGLAIDIEKVAEDFSKGEIDSRLNEKQYKGEFLEISKCINQTFSDLLSDTLYASELVSEFGNGNFNMQIKVLPGKKEVLTNSFKAVQTNLNSFNRDVQEIIKGAIDGNLDVSIDSTKFKGDWNNMANGVNELFLAVVKPIREAISVLNELAQGNLDVTVKGSYKGEFDAMKSALNNTLKMLSNYILEIKTVLGAMADHDLTVSIESDFVGAFIDIKSAINTIAEELNSSLQEINVASGLVSMGSSQVASTSMDLAHRTTEQASSVEELHATIDEITNRIADNAKSADTLNHLSQKSKLEAEQGNKEMSNLLLAMNNINDSSSKILNIIKVIDEIAFQTNLLALNAAIEAARVGEHGKGFGVVAEEVRSLAGRSQSAARETAELIENTVAGVAEGHRLASRTAEVLDGIVSEINIISESINEVSISSQMQSEAVAQVNIGVNQISEVTQQNSATSQEQASASEELASQADLCKSIVNRFRLS